MFTTSPIIKLITLIYHLFSLSLIFLIDYLDSKTCKMRFVIFEWFQINFQFVSNIYLLFLNRNTVLSNKAAFIICNDYVNNRGIDNVHVPLQYKDGSPLPPTVSSKYHIKVIYYCV